MYIVYIDRWCVESSSLRHRVIVASRYFGRSEVRLTWLTLFKEGTTGVIKLPDDDPPSIKRMINYLYTLDYSDEASVMSENDDEGKTLGSNPVGQKGGADGTVAGISPPPDAESINDPDDDETETAAKHNVMPRLMANALVYGKCFGLRTGREIQHCRPEKSCRVKN